jgi:hypothetical protein
VVAPLLVGEQTREALGLEAVEPGVDGVGVADAEQAAAGDGVRCEPLRDLKDSGTTLADIGPGVVVAVMEQCGALRVGKGQSTALGHRQVLLSCSDTLMIAPLPILVVKTH